MEAVHISIDTFAKLFQRRSGFDPRFHYPARDERGEDTKPGSTVFYVLMGSKDVICYTLVKGKSDSQEAEELARLTGAKEGIGMYDDYAHWLALARLS